MNKGTKGGDVPKVAKQSDQAEIDKRVYGDEASKYFDKIKLDNVLMVDYKRFDEFFEYSSSPWDAGIYVIIEDELFYIWTSDSDFHKKLEQQIKESGEFICKSEVRRVTGHYVWERKQIKGKYHNLIRSIVKKRAITGKYDISEDGPV